MKKLLILGTIILSSIALGKTKMPEDYREDNTQVLIQFREDIVREMQSSYISVGNDAYFWIEILTKKGKEDLVEEVNTDMTTFVTMVQQVESRDFTNEDVIKVCNIAQMLRLKWIDKYRQYL